MNITVTVTGLDHVEERLQRLGRSLKDMTGAFTSLGAMLIKFYGNNVFASNGQALGKRWTPLKATTVAEKSKHWPGRGMLVRTGAMQQGFYSKITPESLFIGNRAPWFPYQQLGTGYGGSATFGIARGGGQHIGRGHNIPARPMIGVNRSVNSMIKKAIQADIKAKIQSTM